jgi:hypothetical protein
MAYRRKSEKRDKRPERGGIYPQSIIGGNRSIINNTVNINDLILGGK